jgi:hypothetical protein
MAAVWTVTPPAGLPGLLADALYLAAVAAFLSLQQLGLRLRRAEHQAWWAGSGRDVLNAVGLLGLAGALRLLGLSWPAALLVGGTETLLLFGTTVFLATQTATRHPRVWALVAGLALSVALLRWRGEVVAALGALVRALFGPVGPAARP